MALALGLPLLRPVAMHSGHEVEWGHLQEQPWGDIGLGCRVLREVVAGRKLHVDLREADRTRPAAGVAAYVGPGPRGD